MFSTNLCAFSNVFVNQTFFFVNHPPTRHMNYKVRDFAPSNIETMTNSLSQSVWNEFLGCLNL